MCEKDITLTQCPKTEWFVKCRRYYIVQCPLIGQSAFSFEMATMILFIYLKIGYAEREGEMQRDLSLTGSLTR